ncbi:SpoIIAA-like [Hymenobacter arizonensis]|uniref:SpoIIAA-like n=2 Tax=Hymenobacter arizonensis TaxID=1227077 RepID=A0A1I5ZSL0_HYMAR|nr:SpoIIAA-like [Hymenobacter arizonensis]
MPGLLLLLLAMYSTVELATRIISFRADLDVMVVRWHTHASLEGVQADYAHMLELAKAYQTSDWLLDVRRRDKVSAELSAWASGVYYQQAAAELAPRRLRIAVLNSPALTEIYRTDEEHKKHVEYVLDPARPFDMRVFDDEGEAMRWLSPVYLS